jgi:nucleotide-binding universal stress UspA family protein
MGRVVVGVDGSQYSRRAFRRATHEARLRGATLDAVHVFPPPHRSLAGDFAGLPYASAINEPASAAEARMQAAKQRSYDDLAKIVREEEDDDASGPRPRLVVIPDGHPAEALMEHADGADLLVIGTRGHGGFAGMLLGSVALQCVQHARCPVLILPPNS